MGLKSSQHSSRVTRGEAGGEAGGEADEERAAVYGDGWLEARTLEEVAELERLVDRYAERNPGTVDQSDAATARELLKTMRRSIERDGG